MTFNGEAFGKEIVGVVKSYLQKELSPLLARLDGIEKHLAAMPVPRDGKDADLTEVRQIVADEMAGIRASVSAIAPAPELPDIGKMIDDALSARLDVEDMEKSIEDVVRMVVAEIPVPKDGTSITVDDIRPVIAAEMERCVAAIPRAKDGADGVGLAGAFIDRDGNLIVTMSNGEPRTLGSVVGKDGEPGKPGKDGFNLEDFDAAVMEDGRTVLLSFDRADLSYKVELGFDVMLYRGVFKDDQTYVRGDTVTWAGSLWHCDQPTSEKPGDGSKSWTLCAKKGRDGKDGEMKEVKLSRPVRVGVPGGGV